MPRHGRLTLVMLQPRIIPHRLGKDEGVQSLRSRDAGKTQYLFRFDVAIQRREKQGEVELAESVQGGIRLLEVLDVLLELLSLLLGLFLV